MRIYLGMMNTRITFPRSILAPMFLMLATATSTLSEVKLSALFSDHMVLQSGMQVPIWGTASPGERVTVTLNAQKQSAVTPGTMIPKAAIFITPLVFLQLRSARINGRGTAL